MLRVMSDQPKIIEYGSAETPSRRVVAFRVVVSFAVLAVLAYFLSAHLLDSPYGSSAWAAGGNWFLLSLLYRAEGARRISNPLANRDRNR